ncbi:MAG: hypothetical protein KKB50_15220 [Planctomycetes bacterium]|nr:hypothetical protein [Planctomycetota bacterium]
MPRHIVSAGLLVGLLLPIGRAGAEDLLWDNHDTDGRCGMSHLAEPRA